MSTADRTLTSAWELLQEHRPGGPAAPDVEQDLDEEIAALRDTIDRIVRALRPAWGRRDPGALSSLDLALRYANTLSDLTDAPADWGRLAVVSALFRIEQGKPIDLFVITED